VNVQRFLRQEATLERRTGSDSYAGDTFDAPVTIAVRFFTETERVDNDGSASDAARSITRIASTYVSTTASVSVGDRITDENGTARYVESVRKNRDVKGTFSHFVAALQ